MAPELLEQVLRSIPLESDPKGRLIHGAMGNEDAVIVQIPAGKALVQTVDVLSPIGNDPFVFGQIAAANALSDVYAMGGEPWCAMNLAFFPVGPKAETEGLTLDVLASILQGGAERLQVAGAVQAGGHTVTDDEPKYGLSVTGIIDPDHIARNSGLVPGDQLLLTKPLGTGILSTVVKAQWEGWLEAEKEYCAWAVQLNQLGAQVIREFNVKAATDITGFGLGGHGMEMGQASQVTIRFHASAVPLMEGVEEYAALGLIPAGSYANKRYCACKTQTAPSVSPLMESIVFDAQTSGGLLLGVPAAQAEKVQERIKALGGAAWIIGEALPPRTDGIVLELC